MVQRNEPLRVVLDANVLFSASISSTGHPRQIYTLATRGVYIPILNDFILNEVRETLGRKNRAGLMWFNISIQTLTYEHVNDPTRDDVNAHLYLVPTDKKDVPVVLTAINENADCIVSGDSDLNAKDETTKNIDSLIKIYTPREFLQFINETQ